MQATILETLTHPEGPHILASIEATAHLWKEDDREKCARALTELAAAAPTSVRRASCQRLIATASQLPLSQEKQELASLLNRIGETPELSEYAEQIRQRLQARIVSATGDTVSPTARKHE